MPITTTWWRLIKGSSIFTSSSTSISPSLVGQTIMSGRERCDDTGSSPRRSDADDLGARPVRGESGERRRPAVWAPSDDENTASLAFFLVVAPCFQPHQLAGADMRDRLLRYADILCLHVIRFQPFLRRMERYYKVRMHAIVAFAGPRVQPARDVDGDFMRAAVIYQTDRGPDRFPGLAPGARTQDGVHDDVA